MLNDVDCGQYEPAGQRVGFTVPPVHTKPAGHAMHALWPVWFWYVPAAHGCGLALPPAQNEPSGHSTVDDASPPGHTKPASHGCVTTDMPVSGHTNPAVQDRHALALLPPAPGAYDPGVQYRGDDDPDTQYAPGGHSPPVTPSVGVGDVALATQK